MIATISKQGGRRYPQMRFNAQAMPLRSIGIAPVAITIIPIGFVAGSVYIPGFTSGSAFIPGFARGEVITA